MLGSRNAAKLPHSGTICLHPASPRHRPLIASVLFKPSQTNARFSTRSQDSSQHEDHANILPVVSGVDRRCWDGSPGAPGNTVRQDYRQSFNSFFINTVSDNPVQNQVDMTGQQSSVLLSRMRSVGNAVIDQLLSSRDEMPNQLSTHGQKRSCVAGVRAVRRSRKVADYQLSDRSSYKHTEITCRGADSVPASGERS